MPHLLLVTNVTLLNQKLQRKGETIVSILTNRPLSGRVKYKSISLYNRRAHRFYQLGKSCNYKSPHVDYVEPPQIF